MKKAQYFGTFVLLVILLTGFFIWDVSAGPFATGVSSGAKLAVSLTMAFVLGRGAASGSVVLISAVFVASIISLGLILLISPKVKRCPCR